MRLPRPIRPSSVLCSSRIRCSCRIRTIQLSTSDASRCCACLSAYEFSARVGRIVTPQLAIIQPCLDAIFLAVVPARFKLVPATLAGRSRRLCQNASGTGVCVRPVVPHGKSVRGVNPCIAPQTTLLMPVLHNGKIDPVAPDTVTPAVSHAKSLIGQMHRPVMVRHRPGIMIIQRVHAGTGQSVATSNARLPGFKMPTG